MAATSKKLIILVDCTALMAPFWNTFLHHFLVKIVRHFCDEWQNPINQPAELALIQYHVREPYGACLAEPKGWTTNRDTFLGWLCSLRFEGSGVNNSAIGEALGKALLMFPRKPEDVDAEQLLRRRHCILVAASNPYGFADQTRTGISGRSTIAESIAKLFTECLVSLSVLSPRQLPVLRKIYNEANLNPNEPIPYYDNSKNPEFLILFSQYLEARYAVIERKLPDVDLGLSDEDILMLQKIFDPTTVETKQTETMRRLDVPQYPNNSTELSPRNIQSLQTSAHRMTYREMGLEGRTIVAGLHSMQTEQRHLPGLTLLPRILPEVYGGIPRLIPDGIASVPTTSNSVPQDLAVPQSSASLQSPKGLNNLQPEESQGQIPRVHVEQQKTGHTGKPSNSIAESSSSSGAGTTDPNSQNAEGMESVIARDALHIDSLEHSDTYVLEWQGNMTSILYERSTTICEAMGYKMTSVSQKLTADWPRSLHIGRLLCQDYFEKHPKPGPKEYLIIEATQNHSVLRNLRTRQLCSVIRLPSQTLVIAPTKRDQRFLATIFPGDYQINRSLVPNRNKIQRQEQQTEERQHKGGSTKRPSDAT